MLGKQIMVNGTATPLFTLPDANYGNLLLSFVLMGVQGSVHLFTPFRTTNTDATVTDPPKR